ncbi:sigma-70 family RNA polymerase sigma factor [Lachnospiraceae bacterium 42-17]|jgi:RNA polymerase sigma-70 factor (ECF subfamily)|nr:sigma-70 family RNA polymerase sigma factor [Dorea sp.]
MNTVKQLKLVKKAIKRNPDAYGELIKEYQDYLYKTAYLYVKNDEMALDAVGTAVLKSYLQIHTLRNPEYFKTWITRILINAAYDEQRKLICYSELSDTLKESSYEEMSLEEKYDINTAVTRLPEKYRTVIILKYFNEFSIKEIADIMDAPEGSVKAYLSRARNELRRILKEDYIYAD